MVLLFVILVLLACVILSLIVLVQNPKGGGLAGNIAGFSTQFMGVKQTTDVLEKGTWIFAIVIALLCITSTVFIPGSHTRQVETQQQSRPLPQNSGTNQGTQRGLTK
jgi:preprotein translocase subunit SecG